MTVSRSDWTLSTNFATLDAASAHGGNATGSMAFRSVLSVAMAARPHAVYPQPHDFPHNAILTEDGVSAERRAQP